MKLERRRAGRVEKPLRKGVKTIGKPEAKAPLPHGYMSLQGYSSTSASISAVTSRPPYIISRLQKSSSRSPFSSSSRSKAIFNDSFSSAKQSFPPPLITNRLSYTYISPPFQIPFFKERRKKGKFHIPNSVKSPVARWLTNPRFEP